MESKADDMENAAEDSNTSQDPNVTQSCCSSCNCSGYEETTPLPTMKCKKCGHPSTDHSC